MVFLLQASPRAPEVDTAVKDDWLLPSLLALSVLLQMKMDMMWSESRIFRKLVKQIKRKGKKNIRQEVINSFPQSECHNDESFGRLYTMMSKGRHRTISRVYSYLLLWTFWILDILISFGAVNEFAIFDSEALTVLRLMLSMGALQVVGAIRVGRKRILGVIIICSIPYVLSYFIFQNVIMFAGDYSWVGPFPETIFRICNYIRCAIVVIGFLLSLYPCWKDYLGKDSHVSNLANCIEEGLHESRDRQSQMKRLQFVRKRIQHIYEENPDCTSDLMIADSYFIAPSFRAYVDVFVSFTLFLTNAFLLGNLSKGRLSKIVIVEFFEFIGICLLLVNDTVVEPALLATLIDIADNETWDGIALYRPQCMWTTKEINFVGK